MAKKICLTQVSSDIDWEIERDKAWRYIKESILLRIAEATELMAQNHKELVRERDMYSRLLRKEEETSRGFERTIAGLKGYITKLKKKVE